MFRKRIGLALAAIVAAVGVSLAVGTPAYALWGYSNQNNMWTDNNFTGGLLHTYRSTSCHSLGGSIYDNNIQSVYNRTNEGSDGSGYLFLYNSYDCTATLGYVKVPPGSGANDLTPFGMQNKTSSWRNN
jgi:hypothetical protein